MTTAWPLAPEALEDPYPGYNALRSEPLYAAAENLWVATGYRQVRALLADPRCSSQRAPPAATLGAGDEQLGRMLRGTLARMAVFNDGARHEHLRRPIQRAFAPHVVEPMRGRVRALAEEVLERAARTGEVELVGAVTVPLADAVLGEAVGLSAEASTAVRTWWAEANAPFESAGAVAPGDAAEQLARVHAALGAQLARARAAPASGPLGALVEAADRDTTDTELVSNLVFVVHSAQRTLQQSLALAVHALARHPRERDRLRAEPALLPGAVEELLRWEGPVHFATRWVGEDVALDGRDLEAGSLVLLGLAAANRDPEAFARGDALVLGEHAAGHLAFGHGPHFCAGAALARLVLQEALAALLERAGELSVVGEPRWTGSRPHARGFERLVVRF